MTVPKYQDMKWQKGIDSKQTAWGNYSSYLSLPRPQGRNKRAVWPIATKPFKDAHFATYPEKLCETPIKSGCPKGGIVLDPFFGAGTTGLVAKQQGKNYLGIELNPKYIEIAKTRIKADNS